MGEYITYSQLKEILAKDITPLMRRRGLEYDGAYTWYGPMENHMRKSMHIFLFKGSAILGGAVTFDFLPLPQGQRLVYARTEKRIKPHLFRYPVDYVGSFHGAEMWWRNSPCKIRFSGSSMEAIRKQAKRAVKNELRATHKWLKGINTLEDALREATRQIDSPGTHCPVVYPRPAYCKAFLLAATGRRQEGAPLLEQCLLETWKGSPDAVQQKLWKAFEGLEVI